MFISSGPNERVSLWLFVIFLIVWNVESQSTKLPSVSCSGSQLLCGGSICYDPASQYCTELGTVIQCIASCGNQCYNSTLQQCFNGTLCSLGQQLCVLKYDASSTYQYNPPYPACYNPIYQACLNNTLCSYPSQTCNGRCMTNNQVCVNNVTICNVTNGYWDYQPGQIKLCSGVCYDSATQKCISGTVQCLNNCSGICYNSSVQQCFNGTVCSLGQQLCVLKYDASSTYQYNPPYPACYNPIYQACLNNTLCSYPSQTCNGRCMTNNQVCVNNVTVCNVINGYWDYQSGQIKLCNGACYDSATQKCISGTVQCLNNCSGVCYNSTLQQCFNGTVCSLGQQLCVLKYDASSTYQYNPPYPACYNPIYQACLNNTLCSYPSQTCNGRCMTNNQVCVNNVTVCNVINGYWDYQPGQIKLCSGVCYDSATQKCVGGYAVDCILDPSTKQCINQSTSGTTLSNTTSPVSSNCCSVKDCSTDADCCVQGKECQCFRQNNHDYGSCLNPYEQPICANGCSIQGQCRNDTDCCKCQCGQVTVVNTNGSPVTKKQCVPR